ncbi:protein containing 3-hydroxyacyl-CoA dehydrogenase, partial [mine drainage metagenome]
RIITEALAMHEEGASIEDLDSMVRFRLNFPMGIFELLDFVGIDIVFNANREMKKKGLQHLFVKTPWKNGKVWKTWREDG